MPYMIDDKCIIEEFLNNWFTIEELAQYLCIDEERVIAALNQENVRSVSRDSVARKVAEHYIHIINYNPNDERINKVENFQAVLDVADYIIENHASLRETARVFSMGKTTVYDWIYERLPIISLTKYKQVYDVLMENKSFSVNSKEVKEQVLTCYELLKIGLTELEIAERLNIGRNVVQRNLSYRLKAIDKDKYEEIVGMLRQNQIAALEGHAFGK